MCVRPLQGYRDGSGSLFFWAKSGTEPFKVPCGQCVECRLKRSREWAARCMHEASLHAENCFITLTYKDDPGSLNYRDFQLFMKRLRKVAPRVRFYMCGEYGEEGNRAHFHACLFGYNFADRVRFGRVLYRSALLESLWPLGFSSIGEVTFDSAAYVARYVMKKITGDAAEAHYRYVDEETGEICYRTPEFCHMSLKPGIGAEWLDKYYTDVFPDGRMVVRGKEMGSARYYDKLFRRWDRHLHDQMKVDRTSAMLEKVADNTPDRLAQREIVILSRTNAVRGRSL